MSDYNRHNRRRKFKVKLPIKYDWSKFKDRDRLKKCGSQDCDRAQTYIAGEHSINIDQFEDMIAEFFHPYSVPPPLIMACNEVNEWLEVKDATTMDWAYDDTDKETNEDIEYHFSSRLHKHKPKKGANDIASGEYSDTLFRGITCMFPDTRTFHLYKAQADYGYTIAFAAVGADEITVEYLGNTSDMFP